jgi:signal transduction histidine kinase
LSAPAGASSRTTVDTAMWRALGIYRFLALAYAIVRFSVAYDHYAHPGWATAILVAMTAWSVVTVVVYRRLAVRSLPMIVTDVAVSVAAVLSTVLVDSHARWSSGEITLPTVWSSAPAIACAIAYGWRGGLVGAAAVGAADFTERGAFTTDALHNIVIMALAGTAVGYVTELGRNAERTLIRAQRLEAATRERQRLSRDIHDGVLQVLAMVQRQGTEMGGRGAALGRMAGEQELALRSLVNSWHEVDNSSAAQDPVELDLCALLGRLTTSVTASGPRVTLSAPGSPVTLPSAVAREMAAAVSAALDNVRVHGGPGADGKGARAWILVEEDAASVLVTVRDDGPGVPPGRLEEARRAGRLGVVHSIVGRLRDVGGSVDVVSVPGQGTEVELRVPRSGAAPSALSTPSPMSGIRQVVQ